MWRGRYTSRLLWRTSCFAGKQVLLLLVLLVPLVMQHEARQPLHLMLLSQATGQLMLTLIAGAE